MIISKCKQYGKNIDGKNEIKLTQDYKKRKNAKHFLHGMHITHRPS